MIDIIIYIGMGLLMIVAFIMAVIFEYAMDEMARREKILRESTARRQKWKDLKRVKRERN